MNTDLGQPHILIVEDEIAIATMLRYNLESAGYSVREAHDGEEALVAMAERVPDMVLLDLMLPKLPGIEVCKAIRRNPDWKPVPVIMLTARGEESDRVRGLDVGADDYVTKPFSPAELVARVRAVLRRTRPATVENVLTCADLVMDLTAHRVERGVRKIHLGPTEFRLLKYLMEHPGRVYSREQLLDSVWGQDIYVESRTVDVHVRRLRKALNENGEKDLIRTVRAAGYSLDPEAA